MAISTEPLTPTFGARVRGTTPATIDPVDLGGLLAEHLVLVFEPSALDDDGQAALLSHLGSPYLHPLAVVAGATEARVARIIDDADHPPFQNQWHTDVTWDPDAPTVGSLRCIEMPPEEGDTLWADMAAAHDALPAELARRLDGLTAWHDAGAGAAFKSKAGEELFEAAKVAYPGVERPVVATHPVSGRRLLNVNAGFTSHIVGMDGAESTKLLDELYAHVATPDWHYRHRWTEGEFIVWDELATQHYATADHYPARREMARFVVAAAS